MYALSGRASEAEIAKSSKQWSYYYCRKIGSQFQAHLMYLKAIWESKESCRQFFLFIHFGPLRSYLEGYSFKDQLVSIQPPA